jgi:hypothetical protein
LMRRRQMLAVGAASALPWRARASANLTLLVAGPAGEQTSRRTKPARRHCPPAFPERPTSRPLRWEGWMV